MPRQRPKFRTQRRQHRRAQTGGDYPPILNVEREPYDTDFSYAIRRQDIRTLERFVAENPTLVNDSIEIPIENMENYVNNANNNTDNTDNTFFSTPLYLAVIVGHLPVVKFLVEHGADLGGSKYIHLDDEDEPTILSVAIYINNEPIIDYFISVSPVKMLFEYINKYTKYKSDSNLNLVKKILQLPDFDINQPYKTASTGNITMSLFTILCEHFDKSRIDIQVMRALIDNGAHINGNPGDEISPLTAVCGNHDNNNDNDDMHGINLVAFMLENGANINGTDSEKSTPFIEACRDGNIELADYLINRSADINKTDTQGNTCIHAAAYNLPNITNIISWAINAGIDINKTNNLGQTPLHSAAKYVLNFDNKIKLLLNEGLDINAVDNEGHTPLYIFVSTQKLSRGIPNIISNLKKMLEHGARITPDIISVANIPEVKKYLEMFSTPWKGFTKSDFEKFNTIFDMENPDNMKNVSVCPVCLKYVERSEACNYMKHNCTTDGYAHTELYNKYKMTDGLISWCTICGRICKGHNHYPLTTHDAPVPNVIIGRDPFAPDCRVDGGGGVEEKIMRFRIMREYAAELQSQVDKIPHKIAMNELVEAMWLPGNMPRVAKRIMNARAFNTPLNAFPNRNVDAAAANGAQPVAAVIAPPGTFEAPNVSTEPGENVISANDSQPVIEFKHRTAAGAELLTHYPVNKDSVVEIIGHKGPHTDFDCFQEGCGGILWPEEIRLAFDNPAISASITEHDREALQNYKERFNAFFATHSLPYRNPAAGGGAATDVFQPALNAVCAVPPLRQRAGAKRTTKRWKRARILTAYKKKVRRAAKTRVRK